MFVKKIVTLKICPLVSTLALKERSGSHFHLTCQVRNEQIEDVFVRLVNLNIINLHGAQSTNNQ